MNLAVVTATTNPPRAAACLKSWRATAKTDFSLYVVVNGWATKDPKDSIPGQGIAANAIHVVQQYLGTVPAFRRGVDTALGGSAEVIACLHDDLEIFEEGWDERILRHFERYPTCGLAGFGGALGLGAGNIYQVAYDPMQLARLHFRSNLRDAETHGIRSLLSEKVACLDGFSQIGRREYWRGLIEQTSRSLFPPWGELERLGVVHHGYDGMLGCLAKRAGWETWYVPLDCTHHGGQTAVGDPGYQAWATRYVPGGDRTLWQNAHQIWYEAFRDVLPIRV